MGAFWRALGCCGSCCFVVVNISGWGFRLQRFPGLPPCPASSQTRSVRLLGVVSRTCVCLLVFLKGADHPLPSVPVAMLPCYLATNGALSGGVQLAAFVQQQQHQHQHQGPTNQHLLLCKSSVTASRRGSSSSTTSAAAACGLLVVASAYCPPRPRSGRLQVGTGMRGLLTAAW